MDNTAVPEFAIDGPDLDSLRHLADLNGVATSYFGWSGEVEQVSAASLLRVLEAMGVPVNRNSTGEDICAAIHSTEDAPWKRTLPSCTVVRQGDWRDIYVHVDHGDSLRMWYVLEDGVGGDLAQRDNPVEPRLVDGVLRGRATFEIPGTLPTGYHEVFAQVEGSEPVSAPLYVVPQRVSPSAMTGDKRYWGVNAQAYSVMSKKSWGVGDAEDLADLVTICASEGADFVLINPLHAAETTTPMDNSPYRPVSRRWLNVTYIRPESVPEYSTTSQAERDQIERWRREVLDQTPEALLKRDATWAAKDRALQLILAQPRSIHREGEFEAFKLAGGRDLYLHALWSAICDELGTTEMPRKYRDANAQATQVFAEQHLDLIEYYQWLQWVAAQQLVGPGRSARLLGMPIGIMADLAVGTHPSGSDYWASPEVFASGMYVGAPPDMYSQKGQSWTQPPWIPSRLAEAGYEPFKQVIRAALQLADALRIDHILGLFRLWWLPADQSPAQGTYVYFDHEAMVGILLLEAERRDAVLIGEDLGTVEPWVREYLNGRGILGTSVFWFEKTEDGLPLHADQYRRDILGTVNTHDLPPTMGYLHGVQTELRHRMGQLVDSLESVRARDRVEQQRTWERLGEYELVGEDPTDDEVIEALHRYIARTPARLVAASLVDQVGEKRPQNFPGTEHEYPNWRVPLGDQNGQRIWLEDLRRQMNDAEGGRRPFAVMRDELGRERRMIL